MSLRSPKAAVNLTLEEVRQILIDYDGVIRPHYTTETLDYTTSGAVGHEYVTTDSTGTATQTISLHATPNTGQRVTVKRAGTAAVTVDTAGAETIDGQASQSITNQYDGVQFIFLGSEWSII